MRITHALLCLGLATSSFLSCTSKAWLGNYPQADFNPDQNIILFRSDSSGAGVRPMPVATQLAMIRKANQVLKVAGKDTIRVKSWCPCDSSLVLLEGKDISNLNINGKEMASNTRPNDHVEGRPPFDDIKFNRANNTLDWPQLIGDGSPNYVLSLPYDASRDTHKPPFLNFSLPTRPADGSFIIAITDTGIQPELYPAIKPYMWINPNAGASGDTDRNGLTDDRVGWDFVNNSRIPYDSNGHGTLVTSLVHEQLLSNEWARRNVRFMFLKTYDKEGKGLLFNNLCALSYAEQKRARIVNASWGFYGLQPSALLGYFLNELKANQITFVAAAGNEVPKLEKKFLGIIPYNYRDLKVNPFWPANYSKTHTNVVTVTTVHPTEMGSPKNRIYKDFETCKDQNYSDQYVSLGVFNNGNPPALLSFCEVQDITYPTGAKPKTGSSFATPVVTGRLVSKLGQTWRTNVRGKLIQDLGGTAANGLVADPGLKDKIDQSLYILRK
ncbi:hypothetical protein GCM10027299_50810 [Larkinella ripae]